MRSTISTRHAVIGAGAAAAAALALAATTLSAQAVSGGGYSYQQQGCTKSADRNDQPQHTDPGCHNATAQINAGSGDYAQRWHVLSINSDQLPNGQSPHSGSVSADPGQGTQYTLRFDTGTGSFILVNPIGFATDVATWLAGGGAGPFPLPSTNQLVGTMGTPSAGLDQSSAQKRSLTDAATSQQFYFGADDNLDNGEHDSVNPNDYHHKDSRVADGPSDGGAIQANTHVQGDPSDPAGLIAKNVDPTDMHDPVKAADAGTGACADGVCAGADTSHRKMYQGGCSSCADQSVYNDQNSTNWRSPDCNGQSVQNENDCGANWQNGNESGNIYGPYSERGAYYTDPGVFVYQDPDPQASPEFQGVTGYPLCELYAGTMGVWFCSMQVVPSPGAATEVAPASIAATPTVAPQQRISVVPVQHATPQPATAPSAQTESGAPSGGTTGLPLPPLPPLPLPIALQ